MEAIPQRAAPRTDSLAEAVLLLLAINIVQRGVGFLRGVLFCRWLDPRELGEWDLAFGFLQWMAPLVVLGLPGSFGRYAEHYRQRGQLRTFLRWTSGSTVLLSVLGVAAVVLAGPWVSEAVFGNPQRVSMVWLLAGCLGVVIAFNFFGELFTSLRLYRVVSAMQLLHSMSFALLGGVLLLGWQATASGVLTAYALASLIALVLPLACLRGTWRSLTDGPELSKRSLLGRLLPYAGWIWMTNWLANSFEVADRYLLLHFSGLPAGEALVQVGNYHSSRLLPLLLVSIATMLASVALPHLTHDWEAGRREAVVRRVNLMIKLTGFALLLGAAVILLAAPLVFDVAFHGKYAGGLDVLPWTLTYCTWFGIICIAQNYLWCAERAGLGSLTMLVGLSVNVSLNLVLLPRYGLQGTVLATSAANLAVLAMTGILGRLCGLRLHAASYLVAALPALLPLGPWPLLAVLSALIVVAIVSDRLLLPDEKRELLDVWRCYCGRLGFLGWPQTQGASRTDY
jgi:O-antigen/teichoic acid export membrane protein